MLAEYAPGPSASHRPRIARHADPSATRLRSEEELIPTCADQNPLAQSRRPMDMMVQGRSMSLFQATQQWSTRSV
jgi:hypothetical protein